ncbi:medium-chain acyl-CoA ligase ACSF2, mitochondrial isoform X3 [Pseudopipra pipra]|uniref:medium-chain acyl-CoA ligase ACSF2, mitochondrial isoform X3 n=1 Tax=Pseudopipra pipra TaxID=415032 RepID=UPI003139A62D
MAELQSESGSEEELPSLSSLLELHKPRPPRPPSPDPEVVVVSSGGEEAEEEVVVEEVAALRSRVAARGGAGSEPCWQPDGLCASGDLVAPGGEGPWGDPAPSGGGCWGGENSTCGAEGPALPVGQDEPSSPLVSGASTEASPPPKKRQYSQRERAAVCQAAWERRKEREAKRRLQEEEKERKRALAKMLKAQRPGECQKYITVVLDPALLQVEGGEQILKALEAANYSCVVENQAVPCSITWRRKTVSSQNVDSCTEGQKMTLQSYVAHVMEKLPGKILALAVVGVENYFRSLGVQSKQRLQQAAAPGNQEEQRKGRKRKIKDSGLELTRMDMEEALVDLQLCTQVQVSFFDSCEELGEYATMFTKAVAEAPFNALHTKVPPVSPGVTNSYVQGPLDVPLLDKTVGQCLEETVERFPDREALVFCRDGVRRTFARFKEEVDQAAAGLLALGLKKGDRLGMWGPNKYEWVLMQFATAQAGIILVSVNPAYQASELEFILKKVGCKALVFPTQFKTQKYYDILKQSCPEIEKSSPGGIKSKRLPDLSIVIMLDSKLPGTFHMDEVMQAGDSSQVKQLRAVEQTLSCNEPINIQFTSGTTGSPKGATLSHRNIVNNAHLIGLRLGITQQDHRFCVPAPLYHCLASVGGCMVMALHGSCCIFSSPSFEGKAALEAVSREKCTFLLGTPTMFIDMLSQPDFDSYDLSSLQGGIIAGSPVPPEIMKTIMTKMHIPKLVGSCSAGSCPGGGQQGFLHPPWPQVAYGTTENSPVTFMGFPNDSMDRRTETVGYIFPHTEAKIEDPETGKSMPLNTPGELLIRGYCVMLGYWNDPAKTSEVITAERWYKTGDLGSLDEHGYCKIIGRCKDMIIRGGENIYPAELEQFLHTHPKVEEVQVVGVKDSRMGEEVCACIRLRAGQNCTEEEMKAFCKGKISHFKIPRYFVFVNQYPLTVSGKIQKYKLREQMEKLLQL